MMNRYSVFLKVIETGSFTKAAYELGYTQSAISQQIHSLEEELHATLLARSRKGIELTEDGERYYRILHESFNRIKSCSRKRMKCKDSLKRIFGSGRSRVYQATGYLI